MLLRTPRSSESEPLARLVGELGYGVSPDELGRRLEAVRESVGDLVLVAEQEGWIIGFLHARRVRGVLSGERAEIAALVVAPGARRRGAGRRLVEAAAEWAGRCGVERLRVRTDVRRRGAAAFYRRLGFDEVKRQRVFERAVERAVEEGTSRPAAER